MNHGSAGPVGRYSRISALEAASQQQALPVCSEPVQSIRVQTERRLHLSSESVSFLVNI